MKSSLNITERDIFTYVWNPDALSTHTKKYLEENEDLFRAQIDYCKELKQISLKNEVSESSERIAEKVINSEVIVFLPIQVPVIKKDTTLRLAAAGISMTKKSYSYSFKDEKEESIIKIISNSTQTLLYYLSNNPLPKAKITLLPSGSSYTIMDSNHPIEILSEPEIEKVIVEKI